MASDGVEGGVPGQPASLASGLLVGAAIAALLLGLGVPSLIAAVVGAPGVEVVGQIRFDDAKPSGERLGDGASAFASAARFWMDGSLEVDRGYLLLKRAEELAPGPTREAAYREAMEATRAGLAAAPVQPSAWARLAYLELRSGRQAAALAALRMSLMTGPVTPALMASRLEIGLRLTPLFDQELTGLMKRQIRLLWVLNPDYVGKLSADPLSADLTRAALAELDENDMREFIRQNRR